MTQVLRQAARSLAKSRGLSTLTVALVALCIGGSAAVFSAAKAVLFDPLPIPATDRDRLVNLSWIYKLDGVTNDLAYAELEDWKKRATLIENITPVLEFGTRTLTGGDVPERIIVSFVGSSYFGILGVKPSVGRLFTAEDDVPVEAPVAILSDALWQRRFGGDPALVGKSIELNGQPYTVVGVTPASFLGLSETEGRVEAWLPAGMAQQAFPMTQGIYQNRLTRVWAGLARIKPGVTREAAQAEALALAAQFEKEYPETNRDYTARLIPLREFMFRETFEGTKILFAGALLVVLIGCINVANLLLVRKAERSSELALHLALGSGRRPLVARAMSEGLVLAIVGGFIGILLAPLGILLLSKLLHLPSHVHLRLDGGVLLFALLLTIATGLLSALPSSFSVLSLEAKGTLGKEGLGSNRVHFARSRGGLLVLQTSVVVILLIVSGLLLRSFERFRSADLGFKPEGILTMRLVFDTPAYSNRANISVALKKIVDNVRAVPGVESAIAWGAGPPAIETQYSFVRAEGAAEDRQQLRVFLYSVSPGALDLMGIPLLSGREFTAADDAASPWAAVISESVAASLWPGQDPIGKRLHTHRESEPWITVVGTVRDMRLQGRFSDEAHNVLLSAHQWSFRPTSLLVKSRVESEALVRQIREAVARVDRQVPVYQVTPLSTLLAREEVSYQRNAVVVGLYAALALAFSILGLYGMLAFFVSQRRKEIAVRMALGAAAPGLVRMVMRRGLILALSGLALGVVAALFAVRLMSGVIYGVDARDLPTFIAVALVFGLVSIAATYLPARAAARVEPTRALRAD